MARRKPAHSLSEDQTENTGERRKKIRLSVGTYSGATALDKLAVVQWNGGAQRWQNLGNTGSVGVTAGTVTSNDARVNSAFTIASTIDIQNPLPFLALALTVDIQRGLSVLIATLHGLVEPGVCELQQSLEGREFKTVDSRAIKAGDTSVRFVMAPPPGGALLRLRFSSAAGSGLLSNVVRVPTGEERFAKMHVTSSRLWFSNAASRQAKIRVEIYDLQLRRLALHEHLVYAGQRSVPIDCPGLPAGIYLMRVTSEGRQIGVLRWVH